MVTFTPAAVTPHLVSPSQRPDEADPERDCVSVERPCAVAGTLVVSVSDALSPPALSHAKSRQGVARTVAQALRASRTGDANAPAAWAEVVRVCGSRLRKTLLLPETSGGTHWDALLATADVASLRIVAGALPSSRFLGSRPDARLRKKTYLGSRRVVRDWSRRGVGRGIEFVGEACYIGDFYHQSRQGSGTYRWPDGSRYDGAWEDGRPRGFGCLVTAAGDRLEGHFAYAYRDVRHDGAYNIYSVRNARGLMDQMVTHPATGRVFATPAAACLRAQITQLEEQLAALKAARGFD